MMNYLSEIDNKKQYDYLDKFTQGLSGSGNIFKY